MKNHIYLIIFSLLIPIHTFAQKQGLEAIDSIKQELNKQQTKDTNYIKSVYRIAHGYNNGNNNDSALRYANIGLELAKKQKFDKAIAAFYDCFGNINSNLGKYSNALQFYQQSLAINERIKNKLNAASNLINISAIYSKQGNEVKSLTYSLAALEIAEKNNYHDKIALLYLNLSNSYFNQNNYITALNYTNKAYAKYKMIANENGMASARQHFGNIYLAQKNYKLAYQFYNASLLTYKKIGKRLDEAIILSKIALIYEQDKEKKIAHLLAAQKLFDQIAPNHPNSITNLGNIGEAYTDCYKSKVRSKKLAHQAIPKTHTDLAQKAEFYLREAISKSEETGDNDNKSHFLGILATLNYERGKYKDAFDDFSISKALSDSLYSQESKNKIADMQAQYVYERKEDSYRQQQQMATLKVKQLYLYAAIAVILLGSILLILLNVSRIKQLRLKNELLGKEAEEQQKELIHQYQLSESELKAIRAQMNPHFIFNVLNSIEAYVMDNDKRTASRLIQKFAALSRLILENSTKSLVTADKEWKALMLYTELEAMRYSNVFAYSFTVGDDIQLKTLYLPPMLIQPLIENAILHGLIIDPKPGAHLSVQLNKHKDGICITVEDNGIGLENKVDQKIKNGIKEKSIGLASIKERIDMINKQRNEHSASFLLKSGADQKGTIAMICLPFFNGNPELNTEV